MLDSAAKKINTVTMNGEGWFAAILLLVTISSLGCCLADASSDQQCESSSSDSHRAALENDGFCAEFAALPSPPVVTASKDFSLAAITEPTIIPALVADSVSVEDLIPKMETLFRLDHKTQIPVDISPLEHDEAPIKLPENNTMLSPAQRRIPLSRLLPYLEMDSDARGHHAYVRLLNLQDPSAQSISQMLPLNRVMYLAQQGSIQEQSDAIQSINLWLGNGRLKSAIHYDGQDNLLLQLSGQKHVLLIPPEMTADLDFREYKEQRFYYCQKWQKISPRYREDTDKLVKNHALLNPFCTQSGQTSSLSQQQAKKWKESRAFMAKLSPGEALYLPALWSHAVISTTPSAGAKINMAVNLWFVQQSNSHAAALKRNPDWPEGNFLWGNDLMTQGRYEDAAMAFDRALTMRQGKYFDAAHNLASALERQGQAEQAKAQYRKAFELRRNNREGVQCLCNLGIVAKRQNLWDEAASAYSEAGKLDSASPRPYSLLGNVRALQGRFQEAEMSLRKALEIHEQRAKVETKEIVGVYNSLGVILEQMGKMNEATQSYQKALDLDPSNSKAAENLKHALGKA